MKRRFTILSAALALLALMSTSLMGWGQTYNLISSVDEITNGDYVIAACVGSKYYALSNSFATQISGTEITVTNGTITATDADGFVVTIAKDNSNRISISNGTNFLNCKSSKTDFGVGTTAYMHDVTKETKNGGGFLIKHQTATRGVIYRAGTINKFGNYSTGNVVDGSEYYYVQLFKYTASAVPTCTVDPMSWNFGSLALNSAAQTKTFTVTTANLEHGMNFYLDNYDGFNITNSQTGFPATTTTYEITVSFNPTAVGTYTASLILGGDDFDDAIEVPLTAAVVSNDPTCTINPTTWEFGNVAIGMSATKEFTVTTANLTGDLTLAMSESVYSVTPTTIAQNATTTTVTISFTPTEAGEVYDELSIIGGGLGSATTAIVSGTGYQAQTYTITFDAGSGTCTTETMTGVSGSTITLPTAVPSQACQDAGWTFAGWATTSVDETTTAPTLLSGSYTITSDDELYAVYQLAATQVTTFNIATIAANNNWTNGTQYSSINIDPVTLTASGGGNDGKYYSSDQTWRFYSSSNGTLTVTSSNNNVIAVSSNPSRDFIINNGTAMYTATSNTSFKEIVVTTVSNITYNSNPACQEKVATPVITLAEGTYTSVQTTTITCSTEGATIYYTIDGTTPTTSSTQYTEAITIDQSMTIKAIAVKEGMDDSDEASATYTINLPLSTIDEIFAQATINGGTAKTVTVTFGDWVVSGVSGNNVYVTDNNGKGFIIYKKDHGFAVNDKLSGTVIGTPLKLYNGSAEFTNLTASTSGLSVTHDGEITVLTNATIDNLGGVNTGAVITLSNLTFDGTNLTDGTNNTIKPYTQLYNYGTSFVSGSAYNVTGVYLQYNTDNSDTKEILPRSAADIEQIFTLTIPAFNSQNGGYRLISSPIATATKTTNPGDVTNMLTPKVDDNNTYDLYAFDQDPEDGSGKEWRNYRATNDGFDLEFGKGYLYGNLSDVELVFTGTAYNGDAIVTLTKTDNTSADFPGWNLVGNPFGVNAYIGNRDFYVMEAGSEIILADRVQDGAEYIKPMEGVFVIAANNGEELQFTTTPNGKSSRLGLNLSNGRKVIDRAMVRFDDAQQLPKFQLNRNSTKLYIPQDGKDFAVVCAEEMGAMPVNFKAEDNGTYSLSLSCENVEFSYLHLIDNMTGNDIDLLKTPSYSFEAKTTDYESRFKLVFATGDNSNDDTFAFYSNGSFVINNPSTGSGPAELQVIDITGRIVKSESINGCTNVNVNAAPGVYMLRLVNGDNVKVQKVVVK